MKYLYTKSAAAKLLPFATEIKEVREYKSIQVTYFIGAKKYSTFLSKKTFLKLEQARVTDAASVIEIVKVHPEEDAVIVKSSDGEKFYTVRLNHENPRLRCDCEHAYFQAAKCKHQVAVESYLSQQQVAPVQSTLTSEQVLPILPKIFGWGTLPVTKPNQIYYSQHRVQIWKFLDWSQEGAYLIVDAKYGKVIHRYGYKPSSTGWDKVTNLRQQYLSSIFSIDAEILKIGVKKQDEVKVIKTGTEQHSVFVNGELAGRFAYDDWALGNQYVVEIDGVEFGWFLTRASAEGAIIKQFRGKAPFLQTA